MGDANTWLNWMGLGCAVLVGLMGAQSIWRAWRRAQRRQAGQHRTGGPT